MSSAPCEASEGSPSRESNLHSAQHNVDQSEHDERSHDGEIYGHVQPTSLRRASIVTIFIYALFVFIALEKARATALLPAMVADVGIWVLAAYFLVGLLMNSVSRSKAERLTMTPCCLLLAVSSVLLALS